MVTPFSTFTGTNKSLLTDALLGVNSGITVNTNSITLNASAASAVNFYNGSLAPLGIGSGLLLTSGTTPETTNTSTGFGNDNSATSGFDNGDADINAVVNTVFQTLSYDATSLAFDFTVADSTATSISFDIVFGSDEYPEWVDAFVDSAIVMVNGVNYALFNHDPNHPLSVVTPNLVAGYFQDNSTNILPIEYDGVSYVLKIVAPINTGGATNHIKMAIADTGDHILDSGIFISNLVAGNIPGSGVVSVTPPTTDNSDVVTGSAQDELIDLKGGDDVAYAGAGNDIVVCGSGNDTAYGGSGDDQLKGDTGNDYLDGGDGIADTAVFSGLSSEYSLVYNLASANYTITDSKTGIIAEGIDTLKNVELAQFSNRLFAITTSGLTSVSAPPPTPTNTAGLVILSGIASVGNILTATVSDPDGIPGFVNYQWQTSTDNGLTWSNIGSNSNTYTVTNADIGANIQVIANYTDNGAIAESPVSASKSILQTKQGDLVVTLLQLKAPLGASNVNPLTTLVQDAIDLGLSPNTAEIAIKTVLGLPSNINLQSYDAYGILQTDPPNAQALNVEKIAVQVAILTSLSDDDKGLNLTSAIITAAANNQTIDLSNADDLAGILGLDITGLTKQNYPQPLKEIFDRNDSISQAIADGGGVSVIEQEWQDLLSINDGINSTSIADLSIHINQAPIGTATGSLIQGTEGSAYTLKATDLLVGFSDSDGGTLSVTDLAASIPGTFLSNLNNTWTFTPTTNYNGPVELTYTVIDNQGGSISANQLFVLKPIPVLLVFTGTANADNLIGTTGADSLVGLAGNDIYTVNNPGDIVVEAFNQGTDIVKTSISYNLTDNVENLTLIGTAAINSTGNTLANIIIGNTAANILNGLDGNDTISGGDGADSITGGLGNDTLKGEAGDDTLSGDAGIDILDGGLGADSLTGGDGNDTYTVDNIGDLVSETNSNATTGGTDLVNSSITYILGANLEKLTLTGTLAINGTGNALANTIIGNTAANILNGLDGNDTISGGDGADSITGGLGNDILKGEAGNDTLSGDTGIDILDGGLGADSLIGGDGNDTYTVDNIGDIVSETNSVLATGGTDLVNSSVSFTLGANVENLTLTGSTAINGTGNILDNKITGNTGINILTGGDGNDTLDGSSGNDTLNGDAGNDSLLGGVGVDSMVGGDGNDTYSVDHVGDVVTETNSDLVTGGTDLVNSTITYTLGANVENLTLTGSTAINGTGNTLDNKITGNTGINILTGGDGHDTLDGGNGNDTLTGGDGNDILIGGAGNDSLTGGLGSDIFRFNASSEKVDLITDFSVVDDTIQVKAAFGGGLVAGAVITATQFTLGASATTTAHRFGYNDTTGALWFDSNGSTTGGFVQFATLSTGLPLTNTDIFVI